MARNLIETVMGAVVLVVAAGFLVFAYKQAAVKDIDGYTIDAVFSDVSGIDPGSEVRIGGMKVGVVEGLKLDPLTFQASVSLQIKDAVKIPKDSSAAIVSSGLLGDKFIKLEPGGDEKNMEDGDTIFFTQSSISFEELIGKFVFSGGGVASGSGQQKEEPLQAPDADAETSGESDNPFSLGF